MTAFRDLKRIIRERQVKTGESYTAARVHVMRERAVLLGETPEGSLASEPTTRLEAVVLKVNRQSARVRIPGDAGQLTFRSRDVWEVVPGHLVTLLIEKRWSWKGDDYASGGMENPRIAIDKLGLTPLPLRGGELVDLRSAYEPYRRPDPYAPLWRKMTAKPRADFQMDPIAWGQFPEADDEENPTCEAAERAETGDYLGARELLMEALGTDLRCLDAHAHLGNLEFDHSPKRAIVHYEIGMRIGEFSLPAPFDGVLLWGHIYNRPYLRCLHGYGLCLWRLGQLHEARQVFERILSLSPHDNQGVRFCWDDVRRGRSWEEAQAGETAAATG
ncbi:MAG: tetratricopeptide repeat protein [Steroidobacteraceae bacterium]